MFKYTEVCEFEAILPKPMTIPFTEKEIHKAVKSLKNGKSPGIDNITAEQLKSGPAVVNRLIADILNTIAATGDFPEEMKKGVLVPLQKPGKSKGPPAHLRPIELQSILHKLLAICILNGVGDRIDSQIPHHKLRPVRMRSH